MSIRIVKNTTPSPIVLYDLSTTVPASGQIDLCDTHSLDTLAHSDDLAIHLGNGNLVLNVGGDDVPYPRSIDIIRQVSQAFQTTADDRLIVAASPKPSSTTFSLTSRTDGMAGATGDLIHMNHKVFQYGQDTQGIFEKSGLFVDNGGGNEYSQYWLNTKYVDFDVLGNRTFIFDGGVCWQGLETGGLVAITLDVVPDVFDPTPFAVTPGTGNAAIVNGYLVVPMPGLTGGTHLLPLGQTPEQTPQPFKFTCVPPSIVSGLYEEPIFWSINYDVENAEFFNLLPVADPYARTRNPDTGSASVIKMYGNIITAEVPLASYVRDLLLIGNSNGFFGITSQDATEIGYGIRLRVDCKTIVNDYHVNVPWTIVSFIKTYRESTI